MTRIVNLNESGRRAASIGDLRTVFVLGSYDPEIQYTITVETLEQYVPDVAEGEQPKPGGGTLTLPVKSVGKIGRHFFFATDYRFICFPAAVCCYPDSSELVLSIQWETDFKGNQTGQIVFDDWLIFRSKKRENKSQALEELAAWSLNHDPNKWILPSELESISKRIRDDLIRKDGGSDGDDDD